MKCPYCNEEMVKGYIQCRDGLYWTEKKQFIAALSILGKGRTSLANGGAEEINPICSVVNFEFNEVNKYVYHL